MGLISHQEGFKDASVHSLWALHRLFLDLWRAVEGGPFFDFFLSPSGWQIPRALWRDTNPG